MLLILSLLFFIMLLFIYVVVVNAVVVALFVVTDTIYIKLWSIMVNMRLLKATVEFLWWLAGSGWCQSSQ